MIKSALILITLIFALPGLATIPDIKVRIGKGLSRISVKGTDVFNDLNFQGQKRAYSGKTTVNFNCVPRLSSRIQSDRPVLYASLKSSTGIIAWEGNHYQGDLLVVTTKDQESCDLVNRVPLETYIKTLLTKEMNGKWPIEALKAQAVAARTYAIHKMQTNEVSRLVGHEAYYDVENSEKHQVTGTFFDTAKNSDDATRDTTGEILETKTGHITPIFFHSKCGGITLTPDQAWENKVEGYESVECPFCKNHGPKPWNFVMERSSFQKDLLKFLKKDQATAAKIQVVPDEHEKLALRFYVDDMLYKISKVKFRNFIGRNSVPSNYFKIKIDGNQVVFSGEGNGHGVGLCQFGALDLAERGWDYKKILAHYFPNHILKKLY